MGGPLRHRFAILLLCVLLAPTARAEDTGDLEALLGESVVVTASRSAERASVAPATVFNITSTEIMASGARTVDEALELCGLGIYVNKVRDYATGVDVGAQGILLRDAGRHVLVMLDGMILNSQGTGRVSVNEAVGVPLELIDHIEIMLGPGSVMYGSNAMLAVINIVTKPAKDFHGVHTSAELGTSAPVGENGGIPNRPSAAWGVRYRLALGVGGKFKVGRTDGDATAMLEWNEEQSNSYAVRPFAPGVTGNHSFLPGQTLWGGDATHRLRAPSGVLTLRLGRFRLLVNAFDYDRTTPLTGTFQDAAAREHQTGARLELRHDWEISQKFTLVSRLYGGYARFSEASNYGEDFWCIEGQVNGCRFKMAATSGWVGFEQQLHADWLGSGKVVTLFGYDVRVRYFDSRPADYRDLLDGSVPTAVPLPHASNTTAIGALYLQQVWRPLKWLNLNVGGRLDIDSQFGVRFSPRVAVVTTPTDKTTLRLSYNEAFRAPSQYELHESDPTFRIPAHRLKAETVRSVELELQQRVWRAQLALRAYASFYSDFIDSRTATADEQASFAGQLSPTVDPANVQVNDNIKSLRVFGGSFTLRINLPHGFVLGYTLNVARTYRPDWHDEQRLPLVFGNFRVGWSSGDDGYSVMALGVYSSAREIFYNSNELDGMRLDGRLDLRLAAAGPFGKAKGLSWRVTVGGTINDKQPYALAFGDSLPKGRVLYPAQTQLFGFVGIRYNYAGF